MDEIAEFDKKALDALRQPMEDKVVTVSRVKSTGTFPANFMLVSAMNPCPCGYYGQPRCRCTDYARVGKGGGQFSKDFLFLPEGSDPTTIRQNLQESLSLWRGALFSFPMNLTALVSTARYQRNGKITNNRLESLEVDILRDSRDSSIVMCV